MRNLLLFMLTITSISCAVQEKKTNNKSEEYVLTYLENGKSVADTVSIKDTILLNELQRMLTDPNYKPRVPQHDTIFNSKGKPILVKFEDDFYGASIQKFEYDDQDRPIKITGYDDKNNIRPFYHYIAIQTNKYDQNGNLIEIRSYGENGDLISTKNESEDTPIIRMKYNDKNQLIEEWYLDENENLRAEFAIFKFDYNDKGEQIKKGWYNEKGEKQ